MVKVSVSAGIDGWSVCYRCWIPSTIVPWGCGRLHFALLRYASGCNKSSVCYMLGMRMLWDENGWISKENSPELVSCELE